MTQAPSAASQLPPHVTLSLSSRDVQFLVAANALCIAMVSSLATDDQIEWNMNAFEMLLVVHYSADEANALATRLKALLPPNTPLVLVDPCVMRSDSSFVQ